MERLRRIVSDFATLLALLLCGVILVLWVRSYWRADVVTFSSSSLVRAGSHDGGIWIGSFRFVRRLGSWTHPADAAKETPIDYAQWMGSTFPGRWQWEVIPLSDASPANARPRRFGYLVWAWEGGSMWPRATEIDQLRQQTFDNIGGRLIEERFRGRRVWVPYWLAVVAVGVPATIGVRGWVRRLRRVGGGLCPGCGYDLRASPERCPECGREVGTGLG